MTTTNLISSARLEGSATAEAACSSTLLHPAGPDIPTPAEEAAWQLLKPFINPIDCNVAWAFQDLDGQILTGIRSMNLNTIMNALFNGELVHLSYLTKKKFIQHCRGNAKYYYRSRYNGFAGTGYGSYDNAWKQLTCDAQRYALNGKKFTSTNIALVLLGFDVDCHNGEQDVQKTTALILDLFPGAYHEPSTNSLGRHIYVKLHYDIHARNGSHYATLHYLHSLCSFIAHGIEQQRIRAGYDAMLDQIRGLPTLIGFERENGKPVIIKRTLPDGQIVEKPKLKVTCRSLVIKIPFFKNCTEDSVDRFFQSPFYGLQHLEDIRERMLDQGIGMPEFVFNADLENGINELLATSVDNSEDSSDSPDREGDKHQPNNTHNSVFPPRWEYRSAARDLVAVQNSHERRVEFGMLYARHLGRTPTGQELEMEYRALGLRKSESESDQTTFRFDQISRWLAQAFDPEKCRFDYGGYKTARVTAEALMSQRVSGLKLGWSKGDGNRRISIAKLAALHWCMRHSQGKDGSTRFSRAQAKKALKETLKVGAHHSEVAAMFRLLERVGLIRKQGEACSGWYARSWIVRELS